MIIYKINAGGGFTMDNNMIFEESRSQASEKYKANVVKMRIPEECSIGVSTSAVRSLAKKVWKSKETAYELWETGFEEVCYV